VKAESQGFRFVSFLFGSAKHLLEDDSGITSCLETENDIGLVAKSVFTGFSEFAFMSFHLLCVGFLIHVFLHKNIYFT